MSIMETPDIFYQIKSMYGILFMFNQDKELKQEAKQLKRRERKLKKGKAPEVEYYLFWLCLFFCIFSINDYQYCSALCMIGLLLDTKNAWAGFSSDYFKLS